MESREDTVLELLSGLKKQRAVSSRSREASDTAMKASYIILTNSIRFKAIFRRRLCEDPHAEGSRNCVSREAASLSNRQETLAERIFGACWRCGPVTYKHFG